jgi:hypothetical protein
MGSSSSVGRAPINGVGIRSAASALVMQEVALLLRRTWCGAAGVSTRKVSGEVGEDRRGGLSLASGGSVLSSEGVDITGRHRGIVDRKGVVVLGLLGTADVQIFV